MFGIFKPKPPQSYHWNASAGKMVPCANTPCKLHPSDVICATQKEAEDAHARAMAAKEAQAEKMHDTNYTGLNENGNLIVKLDRTPEERANYDNEKVISYNEMLIGHERYVLSTNGIAGQCDVCKGLGYGEINGRRIPCGKCSETRYTTIKSGNPSDVVLSQDIRDEEDRRMHDFVRTHSSEFNDFILHTMRSGSYLADEAEKQVYHPWYNKNTKEMMANRPQEAITLMKSLSSQYQSAKKDWDDMVAEQKADDEKWFREETIDDKIAKMNLVSYNVWKPGSRNVIAHGIIIETKDFTDKKTKQRRTAYTMYDKDRKTIVVYFGDTDVAKKGDTKAIEGDVWKTESDKNGRLKNIFTNYKYIV